MGPIKVGDCLPNVTLYEGDPSHQVSTAELAKGKKVLMLTVNGAFTPNCSEFDSGYIENYDKIKQKGIDEIVCVGPNDPYVLAAWGDCLHSEGKIRMLSDSHGELCKAAGIELDMTEELGGIRCARSAMIINNGVVEAFCPEPDGKGVTCCKADELLKKL